MLPAPQAVLVKLTVPANAMLGLPTTTVSVLDALKEPSGPIPPRSASLSAVRTQSTARTSPPASAFRASA